MRKRLAYLVDRYLCRDLTWSDPGTLHRAALIVRFSAVASLIAWAFGLVYFFALRFDTGAAFMAVIGLLAFSGPLLLRRTRSPAIAGNLFAALLLAGSCFISYVRDDLPVTALMFCATIPLVTVYLAGKRAAWIWAVVSSLVCVAFYLRLIFGYARRAPALESLTRGQILFADELGVIALMILILAVALSIEASRRAAEQGRQALWQRLQQAQRMESIGTIAAGVVHEINNPLSWTMSSVQQLSKRLNEAVGFDAGKATALERVDLEEMSECARDAVDGCTRVRDIVRGLNLFSGAGGPDVGPVLLNDVIESALRLSSAEVKYRARMIKDLGPVSLVLGNQGRLCEVFLKLLVNAAQSIGDGGIEHNEIGVRTRDEGESVVVDVWDSGNGMPPERLKVIFEPSLSASPAGKGPGLGLSLCSEIVSAHGGRIDVESSPGKGTRFVVRLPKSPPGA